MNYYATCQNQHQPLMYSASLVFRAFEISTIWAFLILSNICQTWSLHFVLMSYCTANKNQHQPLMHSASLVFRNFWDPHDLSIFKIVGYLPDMVVAFCFDELLHRKQKTAPAVDAQHLPSVSDFWDQHDLNVLKCSDIEWNFILITNEHKLYRCSTKCYNGITDFDNWQC